MKKEYISDNKIGELEQQLIENDFYRVHKSFLVNFSFVKEHNNTLITMQNEEQIFISRLRLTAFKKQFMGYLRRGSSGGYC